MPTSHNIGPKSAVRTITLRHCLALALTCALLPTLHARSFWLLPSDTSLSVADQWITVDLGVSNAPFERSTMGMPMTDDLRITAPDGSQIAPQNTITGKLRTVFDVPVSQRGSYRLAIVDHGFFATWKDAQTGNPQRWRGSWEAFAQKVPADAQELRGGEMLWRIETFITVGAPGKIPADARRAGQGLELLPVTHPNDLTAGETAQWAFHLNGKPAADLQITLTPGGFRWRNSAEEMRLKTDAQGRVKVVLPKAGMYLIHARAADESGSAPQARQRLFFYAGTVEVLP